MVGCFELKLLVSKKVIKINANIFWIEYYREEGFKWNYGLKS